VNSGESATAVWVNEERQEQLLASYAPIRGGDGSIVGQIILGTPLNDGLLSHTSDLTHGTPLAVFAGSMEHPIAVGGTRLSGFDSNQLQQVLVSARQGALTHVTPELEGHFFAAVLLDGFAGERAILVGSIPTSKVKNANLILWPMLFVGGLGLLLVMAGGAMLGGYISKPIAELEDGLLLIANGDTDLRFDLEHDVLGGLTTRLNELLNSVQGTTEVDRRG
jgi:methyl-accepting chemotaxis protein